MLFGRTAIREMKVPSDRYLKSSPLKCLYWPFQWLRKGFLLSSAATFGQSFMITVISGTNRHDSMTLRVTNLYFRLLNELGAKDVKLLSLLDHNVFERGEAMMQMEDEYLIPAEKLVFVMPEYNGSFPGILKLMIDNADIKRAFWYKKVALVGVADGRAGNLRGLDHMTNILNYLRMQVLYNKVPISRINEEVHEEGHLLIPATEHTIRQQIKEIIEF